MGARFIPEQDHPFLSTKAQAMAQNQGHLAIYAEEAEGVLGITADSTVTEAQTSLVTGAVARQISTLIEFDPMSVLIESYSRGARSTTYRENTLPMNPVAKQIIDHLLGISSHRPYRTLTSYRGRTLTPDMLLPVEGVDYHR